MEIGSLAGTLLGRPGDAAAHAEALKQFQALKESADGWARCTDAITSGSVASEEELFFCLQVVEHFVTWRYAAEPTAQERLRGLLRHWIASSSPTPPRVYLRNKMAQIGALVFCADFPGRWASFFADVFAGEDVLSEPSTVDFYLRTLIAIDSEVADRDVVRSKEEAARSGSVKDAMREAAVPSMVASWAAILDPASPTAANADIASLCLAAVGAYVAWIDIGLIASQDFVPRIVGALGREETAEAAVDCVCSILEKGMEPPLKLQLIQGMTQLLAEVSFFAASSDGEASTRQGSVVNCVTMELMEAHSKLQKEPPGETKTGVLAALEANVPLLVQLFAHEEKEVSQSVTEAAHAYVVFLKAFAGVPPGLSAAQKAHLQRLLQTAMDKYAFPPDYNHEREGEDEALYDEFRRDVKAVFTNIGMLDTDLALRGVEAVAEAAGTPGASPAQLNLAYALVVCLGEVFPANTGAVFASQERNPMRLKALLASLASLSLHACREPFVLLEYFEMVVRYDKFFGGRPDLLPDIVTAMLDERGLHHPSPKVRSRVAYLFARFVKLQKTALGGFVAEILGRVGDLLATSPSASSAALMSPEDQLFLYEATGSLIVVGNFSPEQKAEFMGSLVGSLSAKFEAGLALLPGLAGREEERTAVLGHLADLISFASRTTKAFSDKVTMSSCGCAEIFVRLMGTFLGALDDSATALLNPFRQYLHRMVVCLDDELLRNLPVLLHKFTALAPDLRSVQDFLVLVQQIVSKFKARSVAALSSEMAGLWAYVGTVLARRAEDEDTARELAAVRRAALQIASAALTHDAAPLVLDVVDGKGERVLGPLLGMVEEAALSPKDPITARQSFALARSLVELRPEDPLVSSFVLERSLPAAFRLPLMPDFEMTDAQGMHVVLEVAHLLLKLHSVKGEEFLAFLCTVLLPRLGFSQQLAQDMGLSLRTHAKSPKSLQKYLKNVFESQRKVAGLS